MVTRGSSSEPPAATGDPLPLGLSRLGLELSDEQIQRMQWLTQIVTGDGEEARFRLIGGLQLLRPFFDLAFQRRVRRLKIRGHVIELRAESLQFVARFDRNAMIQDAGTNPLRTSRQCLDRHHHPFGEQQSRQRRHRKSTQHDQCGI